MKTRLVPLAAGDAEPLAALHRACFPQEPWDAGALAAIIAVPGSFGYFALEDKSAGGFLLARDLGTEIEILSLGVLPRRRRRGLGQMLIGALFAEAGRRRRGSIVLEVAVGNTPARRLYVAFGFAVVGRRRGYYRTADGLADALIMRCAVEDAAFP